MVTEENTAVSFHGKEKSEELGLEVSLVFFTVSSSISHKSSGQDVSVSRTGQPSETRSVPVHLDVVAIQVTGHIEIIIGSRFVLALLQLLETILPNGNIEEDFSG